VPPKLKTRGKLPTFTNLPPSGIQDIGKPLANEGGENKGPHNTLRALSAKAWTLSLPITS